MEELNAAFAIWLHDDYHHKLHTGINERPIDRYHRSASHTDITRPTKAELDEIFLVRHERVANNDSTISFKENIFEVPTAYIRQRIDVRHPVDAYQELYLYDKDIRVCHISNSLINVRMPGFSSPIRLKRISLMPKGRCKNERSSGLVRL